MKLHLGCGTTLPEGWINVDYAVGARLRKLPLVGAVVQRLGLFDAHWHPSIQLHDLRQPFPWSEGAAAYVYSAHFLEHITKEAGERFLAEAFRVLRRSGVMRIVVPDLRSVVEGYLSGAVPARDFLKRVGAPQANSENGLLRTLVSVYSGSGHRCMYDEPTLLGLIRDAGFEADVAAPFDSAIPDIEAVENERRVQGAVIIEATKP